MKVTTAALKLVASLRRSWSLHFFVVFGQTVATSMTIIITMSIIIILIILFVFTFPVSMTVMTVACVFI